VINSAILKDFQTDKPTFCLDEGLRKIRGTKEGIMIQVIIALLQPVSVIA